MSWGRRVHEVLERHLKDKEPLPDGFQHMAHLYNFPPHGYTVQAELKLGIAKDGGARDFFADDVYARGVLDVVLTIDSRPDTAVLIDHKTGKVREDPGELEFHAVLLRAHYPQLRNIKGWYNWLANDRMGSVHDLSDTHAHFEQLRSTQERIRHAFVLGMDAFPLKQSPLCGWCPVMACRFHP